MKHQEFKEFLSTLTADSHAGEVQNKIETLAADFKDYFYFNTFSSAWHMSDKKNSTNIDFTFSFFIPQLSSEKTIEIFSQNYISGEKRHGKIRFKEFSEPEFGINFNEIEPFNAAAKMYEIEPQYQEVYEELNTDNIKVQFNNKEINSFTKAENFTEYVNKVRNEYILPYLFSKMENDSVEIKMGENIISIHMPKEDRMRFIKGVNDACTKLISDIDNRNVSSVNMISVFQALDEHDNKAHAQWLDSQLPVKEDSKRLKKI
jgi:hypothetical protein